MAVEEWQATSPSAHIDSRPPPEEFQDGCINEVPTKQPTRSPRPSGKRLYESRREREFFRYAHCVSQLQHFESAPASRDTALTAYTQLVTLRLDAKRAALSLFDQCNQYILAEATRTLSLQNDSVHADPTDTPCWGSAIRPRTAGFCKYTLQGDEVMERSAFIVPDLQQDERFSSHEMVVSKPFARSYAGVPLITPNGFAIGTLALFDDKPRAAITDDEVVFMQDVATTIMAHLEMLRLKAAHGRGLSMVKGLSRFIEGKGTLDDDDVQGNVQKAKEVHTNGLTASSKGKKTDVLIERQRVQTANLGASARTHAMNNSSNAERFDAARGIEPESTTPYVPALPFLYSNQADQANTPVESPKSRSTPAPEQPTVNTRHISVDLQEALLSSGVRQTFERAAGIVQRAMDASGVVFLDASIGRFGGRSISNDDSTASEGSDSGRSRSDSQDSVKSPGSTGTIKDQGQETEAPEQMCRVLGATLAGEPTSSGQAIPRSAISERYLKSLMRRFSFGKIWNFDEEGLGSSDDVSDSSEPKIIATRGASPSARSVRLDGRRRKRGSDSSIIQKLFPGVRSLALMPLWDNHRERFFASAVVWNYAPTRVFSFQEDINYLAAFCDVIMAEVGRLDARAEARTKTSFMSSISHELRSPLHGILGGVESLREGENEATWDETLEMIDSCGRSLLDIIDHLLDHTQAISDQQGKVTGKATKQHRPVRSPTRSAIRTSIGKVRKPHASSDPGCDLALLTEEVMDAVLWTTPKCTPHCNSGETPLSATQSSIPLRVILDVDPASHQEDWMFRINPGAWRRLVLNLITNSIKYTDAGGYLKLTLSLVHTTSRDGTPEEVVHLTCADSGRGMNEEYLNHGLWKAFSQEDTHAQGTGLGLSLVHSIVKEAGGNIEVRSSKGVGTTVTLALPLARSTAKPDLVEGTWPKPSFDGSTYRLLGLEEQPEDDGRSSEARGVLRDSLEKACADLGLRPVEDFAEGSAKPDLYIISEERAASIREHGLPPSMTSVVFERPCLVLCHSATSSRALAGSGTPWPARATALSQPLGPRKLAKALNQCFERSTDTRSNSSTAGVVQLLGPRPEARRTRTGGLSIPDSEHSVSDSLTSKPNSPQLVTQSPTPNNGNTDSANASPRQGDIWVLLVDDNDVNLKLLQSYMRKRKHHYVSASNGSEALEAYKNAHPRYRERDKSRHLQNGVSRNQSRVPESTMSPLSVILMDVTMPVMDGLTCSNLIRLHERALGIKPAIIIALTALSSPEARQEAFSSGINLFLTKPVRLKGLDEIFADLQAKATKSIFKGGSDQGVPDEEGHNDRHEAGG